MSPLLLLFVSTLLHQGSCQSIIVNSLDANYVQNAQAQVLDAATAANVKRRCVGFRFNQAAALPPNPIQVTSAFYRVAGLAAAVLTNGVVTTAAETALGTIRQAAAAATPLIPSQTAYCTFTTITGSAETAAASPLGQNVQVTPTAPCTLERDTNYFVCLEAVNGILTWVNTNDAAGALTGMAATLGTLDAAGGTAVLNTFATQTGAQAAFAANAAAQATTGGGGDGFSMVRLLGVFAFSPSPVTTPRPSPSPVTVTTTTPVANDGSDSALYGLFALIALPVLLAIAALAACWYYLTRRPAGLELQEQVPRHYQQAPPPTPAPAVPYFPSVYAPGAYMPAPGMVLPPAYAF